MRVALNELQNVLITTSSQCHRLAVVINGDVKFHEVLQPENLIEIFTETFTLKLMVCR